MYMVLVVLGQPVVDSVKVGVIRVGGTDAGGGGGSGGGDAAL